MDMGIDCRKQMEKYLPPILIISADGSILDLTSNVSEYFPSGSFHLKKRKDCYVHLNPAKRLR